MSCAALWGCFLSIRSFRYLLGFLLFTVNRLTDDGEINFTLVSPPVDESPLFVHFHTQHRINFPMACASACTALGLFRFAIVAALCFTPSLICNLFCFSVFSCPSLISAFFSSCPRVCCRSLFRVTSDYCVCSTKSQSFDVSITFCCTDCWRVGFVCSFKLRQALHLSGRQAFGLISVY